MLDTIGTLKRVKQLSQLKTTTTTNSLILVLKLVTLEIDVMEEFYSGQRSQKSSKTYCPLYSLCRPLGNYI